MDNNAGEHREMLRLLKEATHDPSRLTLRPLLSDVLVHEALERELRYPMLHGQGAARAVAVLKLEQDHIGELVDALWRRDDDLWGGDHTPLLLALRRLLGTHFRREETVAQALPSASGISSAVGHGARWQAARERLRCRGESDVAPPCIDELALAAGGEVRSDGLHRSLQPPIREGL